MKPRRPGEAEGRGRATVVAALLTVLLAGAGGLAGGAAGTDRVTFRMNWYWRGIHAPFALAFARGHFERAGVEVELLEGRGSGTTVQLVGSGADTFGFVDGFTLALAAARGMPVQAVATVVNGSSFAVVSLEESGIRSATDLEGKTLGVTPGDGHTQVWPAVVAATRLNADSIRLVYMDPKAKGAALTQRRVDAILGSAADLPVALERRGVRTRVMTFAELGVPAVGFTIVAHRDTIRDRPDLVRLVVAATLRGFEEAAREPEAAVEALARMVPLLDVETARRQLAVDLSFLFTRANAQRRLGYGAREDWEATLDLVRRYRESGTTVAVDAVYTNKFLP